LDGDRAFNRVYHAGEFGENAVAGSIDNAPGEFANHPALIERGLTSKNELRQATFEVFAPEFALLSEAAREELADAIGAALSLDAWIVLRRRDGMSFERATAVWRRTLTALLAYGSVVPAAE
jgi:hypothetical protein